jgi:hypothetical protein
LSFDVASRAGNASARYRHPLPATYKLAFSGILRYRKPFASGGANSPARMLTCTEGKFQRLIQVNEEGVLLPTMSLRIMLSIR